MPQDREDSSQLSSDGFKRSKRPALTPSQAISEYKAILTQFELAEIITYQNVYYCGENCPDKINGVPRGPQNCGYDESDGIYRLRKHDHLEYRFEILDVLGSGSFGCVVEAFDYKKDLYIAVKIVRNKRRFQKQALLEVQILEKLMAADSQQRSHIVRVYGYFSFRNHLCISFEKLSINLYELIHQNRFQGFNSDLLRHFASQLLKTLKLLEKMNIIHCDIKPENILMLKKTRSAIKTIDFGSSCYADQIMYTYVQSRFYRAPEVILELPYGTPIDMWSLGCVLCELYTGSPIFPGENEHDQLACMLEVLDLPPYKMIDASPRRAEFFDGYVARIKPTRKGRMREVGSKPLVEALRTRNQQFVDFIAKCLQWDPKARITPEEAMKDPWVLNVKPTDSKQNNASASPDLQPTSQTHSQPHSQPPRVAHKLLSISKTDEPQQMQPEDGNESQLKEGDKDVERKQPDKDASEA